MSKAKTKVEPTIKPLKFDADCQRCKLHESSKTVCCEGSGNLNSDLWLFGEALGAREEEIGRPFVGDAGFKLNYCLGRADIQRKEIRIENVTRCRPPKNRKPSKSELKSCFGYSLYLILKHKPKVIVALGALAYDMLSGKYSKKKVGSNRLSHERGFYHWQEFSYTNKEGKIFKHACWLVPTFHPAFCLRKWEADDLLIHDLLIAKALISCGHSNEQCEPLQWPKTKVTVLNTKDEAVNFLRHLRKIESFVVDIEDTSLQVHDSTVMCIGFCHREDEATILPLHLQGTPPKPKWSRIEYREIIDELTKTLVGAELLGQNIKYDIQRFRKLTGLTNYKIKFDTMIAHHVIDENKPHNLTFLSQWYLRWKKYDSAIDPYIENGVVKMWLVPDWIRHTYCCHDVNAVFKLHKKLKEEIAKDKVELPYQIEHDLIVPLSDIEYRGVHLDVAKIKELAETYRNESAKQLKILRKIALNNLGKKDFNPNSPKQVIVLLKQVRANLVKETKGGNISVNKFVLAELALKKNKAGRIARALTTFRKMEKYVGTYLDGDTISKRLKIKAGNKSKIEGAIDLLTDDRGGELAGILTATNGNFIEEPNDENGFLCWVKEYDRIHPNYNQAIARTGRLSADDPPIQTIPRTGNLRSMLIPDVVGEHVLISVDYQKLELCVMAWLANDEMMISELLRTDLDIHTLMAVTTRLMRNPMEEEYKRIAPEVSKNERAIAKCFHPETEVLTKRGWVKILELESGEEVIQATPGFKGDVAFEWTVPLNIFSMKNEYDHLLRLKNEGIDLMVTPDHGMIVWRDCGRDPWKRIIANEFIEQKFRYWANAGYLCGAKVLIKGRLKEKTIRLAVAVQADGSYNGLRIRLGFTKQRKIERLKKLLEPFTLNEKYEWRCETYKNGVTNFVLGLALSAKIKNVLDGKSFPWWWIELPESLREAVLDEAQYWDSHKSNQWVAYRYSNTDKQSIDVLQAIASLTGRKSLISEEVPKSSNHKIKYSLSIKDHAHTRSENLSWEKIAYRGEVACLTVNSGCLLVRSCYDGARQIPVVTQNSVNFGIPYGRGARAIAETFPEVFPLGQPMKQRTQTVQKVINAFLDKYYKIAEYRERQIRKMHKQGRLRTTVHKRLRRFGGIDWFESKHGLQCEQREHDLSHLEREALNCEIQSIGSDILSQATKRVFDNIKKPRFEAFRIIMSLHDALDFNIHKRHAEEAIPWIRRHMEIILPKDEKHKFEMPIKVDCSIQEYWGQGEN